MKLRARTISVIGLSTIGPACGITEKSLLSDRGLIPLELRKVDFSQKQSAQELVSDPLSDGSTLLSDFAKCNPPKSIVSQHTGAFLKAQSLHVRQLAQLESLPAELPKFPASEVLQKALAEFKASGRKVTPREKSLESNENVILNQKFIGKKMSPSKGNIDRLQKSLALQKETKFISANYRWFYSFSLEPTNEYQWLVLCSQVELKLIDGTITKHIWPSFSSLESDSLSASGKLKTSFRPELKIEIGSGFSVQTPEVTGTIVQKSLGRLNYRLSWSSNWGRRYGLYFREADTIYFSRFFTHFVNDSEGTNEVASKPLNSKESSASSFQITGTKSIFESYTNEANELKSKSDYRNLACNSVNIADDRAFQTGGLHFLDKKIVQSSLVTLATQGDTLPLQEGQKLCQAIYAAEE